MRSSLVDVMREQLTKLKDHGVTRGGIIEGVVDELEVDGSGLSSESTFSRVIIASLKITPLNMVH